MEPGSLVVVGCQLTNSDRAELIKAGYAPPIMGKDIYEVKKGPYLAVNGGKSFTVVEFFETDDIIWNTEILVEVDAPKKVNWESLISK